MAQFKVGDRVRLAFYVEPPTSSAVPLGAEGTVTGFLCTFPDKDIVVQFDGDFGVTECVARQLAPLTDPRASQFVEDMERFARVVNVPLVPVQ